jgi:hypothetical protein
MSERNGDRARFQKDRKRKLRRRERIQELVKAIDVRRQTPVGPVDVSVPSVLPQVERAEEA